MRPIIYYNFLNPDSPPQLFSLGAENNTPQFQDLMQQWPVKKVLTSRDKHYSQVLMPRDQVEDFILPKLLPEEQNLVNSGHPLQITVRDLETLTEYRVSFWENGSSYVLSTGWNSSFVRRRRLEVGEEVGFCWDERLKVLRFSVLSRPPVGCCLS